MKKSSSPGKSSPKVTLADVAAAAGCSKSTASCAILRNHPISEELRQRVARAVDKLGYVPYFRRRDPAKPRVVAVVCDTQSNNGRVPELFYEALQKHGFEMILIPLTENFTAEKLHRIALFLKEKKSVCGIINTCAYVQTLDLCKLCSNLPVVMYDRPESMYSCGGTDFGRIMQMAVRHFAEHGFGKAAFLFYECTLEKYRAAGESALSGMTKKLSTGWIGLIPEDPVQVASVLDHSYDDGKIKAYFLQDTKLASIVLNWAYRKNLRVPEDLSLLVIDYFNNAGFMVPPLNALTFPKEAIVEHTVTALLARMSEKETDTPDFAMTLADRGSVSFAKRGN